jgi:hypothetical protein
LALRVVDAQPRPQIGRSGFHNKGANVEEGFEKLPENVDSIYFSSVVTNDPYN